MLRLNYQDSVDLLTSIDSSAIRTTSKKDYTRGSVIISDSLKEVKL